MADLGDDAGESLVNAGKKALKEAGQMIGEAIKEHSDANADKDSNKLESLESRAEKARAVSKAMAQERGAQSLDREIPHAPMSR